MGKKKKTESLNLKNPKQLSIIHSFAIAEGRLSKEQIFKEGNKEIFYRMKNNGYIKETVKGSGIFRATGKMQKLTDKIEGIQFSIGCSSKHSETIMKAVSFLPKDVIGSGRFESGQSLKNEMSVYKKENDYQRKIQALQKAILQERREIDSYYQNKRANALNRAELYQAGIDYRADIEENRMKQEILFSDNPLYVPDFKVTMDRYEVEETLQHMQSRIEELERGKEQEYLMRDVERLENMLKTGQEMLEVYFEIVTNSYGKRELEMHRVYEEVMDRTVLYIY